MSFEVLHEAPTTEDYCSLRVKAGLSPRERSAAEIGLKGSLFSVIVKQDGKVIGMGRIVGDGGCHVQIVDIAVDPDFQGKGIGRVIMTSIMNFVRTSLPRSCLVNLFADVDFLYQKYGFAEPKKSKGMFLDWSRISSAV